MSFCWFYVGAGYHSESKAKEYKHVCKRACQRVCLRWDSLIIGDIYNQTTVMHLLFQAVDQLNAGALAVEAVAAALVELEVTRLTSAKDETMTNDVILNVCTTAYTYKGCWLKKMLLKILFHLNRVSDFTGEPFENNYLKLDFYAG